MHHGRDNLRTRDCVNRSCAHLQREWRKHETSRRVASCRFSILHWRGVFLALTTSCIEPIMKIERDMSCDAAFQSVPSSLGTLPRWTFFFLFIMVFVYSLRNSENTRYTHTL